MSLKQAFLRSLTKPPEIDDFVASVADGESRSAPGAGLDLAQLGERSANASAVLKKFPAALRQSRELLPGLRRRPYLMTSEGTTIRTSRSLARSRSARSIRSADDGMELHNYYAAYAPSLRDLPDAATVSKGLRSRHGTDGSCAPARWWRISPGRCFLTRLPPASIFAQVLPPSLSGARPPLSMTPAFDEVMERIGGAERMVGAGGSACVSNGHHHGRRPHLERFSWAVVAWRLRRGR